MTQYIYARVSSEGQNLESQLEVLQGKYPDAKLVQEKMSGKDIAGRQKFKWLLEIMGEGDTLIVLKFDRLGRNKDDIRDVIFDLRKRGIKIIADDAPFDINDPIFGDLFVWMYGMVAEMERNNIKANSKRGVLSARKKRKYKGSSKNNAKWNKVRKLLAEGQSHANISKIADINPKSIYRIKRYDEFNLKRDHHKTALQRFLKKNKSELFTAVQLEKHTAIPRELIREFLDEIHEAE